jgi:hypothetical protein
MQANPKGEGSMHMMLTAWCRTQGGLIMMQEIRQGTEYMLHML